MLDGDGETLESVRSVETEESLEKIDMCLVSGGKSWQVTAPIENLSLLDTFHPLLPILWGMFDRKLCSRLNLSRIQNGKFIDQIIKNSPKVVYSLPNENAKLVGDDISAILQSDSSSSLRVYVPLRWAEGAPKYRHFCFESRQVLLCPTYSLISAIEWVHGKTIQRNGHIV